MVWGMDHPPLTKEYFVEGEFEGRKQPSGSGWRERLRDGYPERFTEAEQAALRDDGIDGPHHYAAHAIAKFGLRAERHHDRRASDDIQEHEIPRYFAAGGSKVPLASLASFGGPILHVDEALKTFLEWVEPGVHRFIPIEIRLPKDQRLAQQRYILVIGRILDSVWPEMSGKDSILNPTKTLISYSQRPVDMRKLAFRKSAIRDAHLWQEWRLTGCLTCFSDRLQREIVDAGLKIPKLVKMREI